MDGMVSHVIFTVATFSLNPNGAYQYPPLPSSSGSIERKSIILDLEEAVTVISFKPEFSIVNRAELE